MVSEPIEESKKEQEAEPEPQKEEVMKETNEEDALPVIKTEDEI